MYDIKTLARVARFNFLPASLLPYWLGVSLAHNLEGKFFLSRFILGSIVVAFGHLSGNLFNEYFDHKTGADDIHDKRSPFFGGSKSIQDGVITPQGVFTLGMISLLIVITASVHTIILTRDLNFLLILVVMAFFTIQYTAAPLRLAYNGLGEITIFFLFGVGLVLGSYYLMTAHLSASVFLISLPVAFLVSGIILCNEVPDFDTDIQVNKRTLIGLVGKERGYLLYSISVFFSAACLVTCVLLNILPKTALLGLAFYPLGIISTVLLKNHFSDTNKLITASRNTVLLHALVCVVLLLSIHFRIISLGSF